MDTQSAVLGHEHRGSKGAFARHYVEMVVVMFIGMGVFSGLAALVLQAAGSSVSDPPGSLRVMLMGVYMTVPMVIWMSVRGHSVRRNAEMAASMVIPTAMAAAFVGIGTLDVMDGMLVQHVVMLPAMLAVMLWRYDEYSHPHLHHD